MVTTATRLKCRHCRSDISIFSSETFLRILQQQMYSSFEQQRLQQQQQQQQQQQNIPIPRSLLVFVCTPIHYFTDTFSEVGRYTPRYRSVGERSIQKSHDNARYHARKTGGIFKWFKCDGFSYTTGNTEDRDIIID